MNRKKQEKEQLKNEIQKKYRELGSLINELLEIDEVTDLDFSEIQQENIQPERDLEKTISNELLELGIFPQILGYTYLKSAIAMVIEEPQCIKSMVKTIYIDVAKKYGTTPARVERAIRHAVEKVFYLCGDEQLCEIFGNTINQKGKATNSEFIAIMSERIKQTMNLF